MMNNGSTKDGGFWLSKKTKSGDTNNWLMKPTVEWHNAPRQQQRMYCQLNGSHLAVVSGRIDG
jgi:hypothetical protein